MTDAKTTVPERPISAAPPTPGAEAALALGCTCPVIDNARGKGTPMGFWVNEDCPLHGTASKWKQQEQEAA